MEDRSADRGKKYKPVFSPQVDAALDKLLTTDLSKLRALDEAVDALAENPLSGEPLLSAPTEKCEKELSQLVGEPFFPVPLDADAMAMVDLMFAENVTIETYGYRAEPEILFGEKPEIFVFESWEHDPEDRQWAFKVRTQGGEVHVIHASAIVIAEEDR